MIPGNADVQQIIQLLDDSEYDEFEMETDQFKLVLRRGESGWSQQRQTLNRPQLLVGNRSEEQQSKATGDPNPDHGQATEETGLTAIPAPIVGTFYRSPTPGAAPFVEPGSQVTADTVIAIIEVMKLMNSVTAGVAGEVVDICVEDAGFVEQGHCLMTVRTAD